MLRRVRIKKVPQAKTGFQVDGSLYNDVPSMGGGADYNAYIGKPKLEASRYITAVPRDEANLEAEGGETVYGDINGDGMPEHKTIKGPRHSEGGVPLKLPDDSFIFSDTKSMKIKEPQFLAMFGKMNGSYTPADLAKQYDVERYRKILQDPESDALDRKTAELMLKNYTLKLGALALAQESKKGFPQGIPAVARPYMETMGIKDEDVLPDAQITKTVEQLDEQAANQQRSADTMASPTEEQDEQYGPEAEEAQMINSDRPVAMPEPEVDEEAGMMPQETQMAFGGVMSQNKSFAFQRGGWMPEEITVFTGVMPDAAYGMAMGANPENYEGRVRRIPGARRFFQSGGPLPKADKGIEIDVTGMTPEQRERAFHDARKKPENAGKTIYALENGKRKEVKYKKLAASELTDVEGVDMSFFGNTPSSVAAAAQYKLLENNLKDNEVMQKLCDETIASLKDKRSYKQKDRPGKPGKQGETWEERGYGLPDCNEIKNSFLTHQKRNLAFQGRQIDPNLFTDSGQGLASLDEIVARKARDPQTGKVITTRDEAEAARKFVRDNYGGKSKDASGKIIDVSVNEVAGKIGIGLENDEKSRALQQATFHGFTHMSEKLQSGAYGNPDFEFKARNMVGSLQRGVNDENSMQGLFNTKGLLISPIDDFNADPSKSFYGNTTTGHVAGAGLDKYDLADLEEGPCECEDGTSPKRLEDGTCPCQEKKKVTKPCPCKKSDGTEIDTGVNPNTGECNPCEEDVPVNIERPAEWWLQDTIKTTGAFGDLMSIKKHMPWAPRVDLETPRPTFLDPTRELAANAEQANIQTQGMAQFAGPQAMSARSSSVQGQSAKNAADILSRYNNANVNIANQFETQATNIRNQEQGMNQAATQRLYDQNTIANQQYDNAKMAMRNNLRNQYTNAITNRAKTDALNQLYPQYAVSPGSGGFMHYTQGRALNGQSSGSGKTYDEWFEYYKDKGQNDADAATNAKNAYNTQNSGTSDNKAAILQQMYSRYGGQMEEGGFVYGDITYPFIM
jgi:hypothetical protein